MALIAVTGYGQVGKDSVGARLVERWGFTRLAFADALKELARRAHPKLNEQVAGHGWDMAKRDPSVRALLQHLGVAAREVLGPDVWINAGLRKIERPDGHFVFTDVRFPNEADALKQRGAITVRVVRPDHGPINGHESETAMDDYPCDIRFRNNGSLDDLARRVDGMAPFFLGEVPNLEVL